MLPQALADKLASYPNLQENLTLDFYKEPLPANYNPETVEVMFDEFPVYCWADGREVLHLDLPVDTVPQLIEWAFDGELVYVTLDNQPILNRLENVASLQQLRGNYAS